jgi:hypothetical protein
MGGAERAALIRSLEQPRLEVLPLPGVEECVLAHVSKDDQGHRDRLAQARAGCHAEGHRAAGRAASQSSRSSSSWRWASSRAKRADRCDIVSQICFDAETIRTRIAWVRARGTGLPIWIGRPGTIARRDSCASR